MARKSINFLRLKRLGYVRAGPLPGHKKNGFSVPGNAGALYCNGACRNRRIGGLSLAPKIPQIVEGSEGHRMTDHPGPKPQNAVGHIHDIKLNNGTNRPAWFVLNKENASRQIRVMFAGYTSR